MSHNHEFTRCPDCVCGDNRFPDGFQTCSGDRCTKCPPTWGETTTSGATDDMAAMREMLDDSGADRERRGA